MTKAFARIESPTAAPTPTIGIDFGTTNTVLALSKTPGEVEFLRFDHRGESLSSVLSALCFWSESGPGGRQTRREVGPWAVDEYLERIGGVRLLQSFKTFAGSAAFTQTRIFGAAFGFEEIMAAFLRCVLDHAGIDTAGCRVVVGRPVRFAGHLADDDLAIARYRRALGALGLGAAGIENEPVAAAHYASRALPLDGLVLIADFGGGTSDFSILRMDGPAAARRILPLGQGGVGIAGDSFDRRIIERLVAPRLGGGTTYLSFGKRLAIPNRFHASLSSWSQLAMMKGDGSLDQLRALARQADDGAGIAAFVHVIEHDLSLPLYRAVARAKAALSGEDSALFEVDLESVAIAEPITRAAFESWIAGDVARIGRVLDETLAAAGVAPGAIDHVVATGGTSRVPAVRAMLRSRFPGREILESDPLHSIAAGLALMGQLSLPPSRPPRSPATPSAAPVAARPPVEPPPSVRPGR
ncbi:MAG: Hsp70 family protein [Roseiarcus sp.]